MNLILFWLGRRALELGGLAGALLTVWQHLPVGTQNAIVALLSAKWETVTIGSLAPLAVALGGYVWSFVATIRPQVVSGGKKISIKDLPSVTLETKVKQAVQAVKPSNPLGDALSKIFNR